MNRVLQLPYGQTHLNISAPADAVVAKPGSLPAVPDARAAVADAIAAPIGSPRLRDLARGKTTATIVINDITRPTPTQLLVEELLAELGCAGIRDADVTLLVATGNHRPNTPDELAHMVGSALAERLRIVNHDGADASQLVVIGTTPRGVKVDVNRLVVESDLTILTGTIAPHQTAGFSGGRKSIMPGVASHEALRTHHSYPIRSLLPVMGQIEHNHFHEEAVAAARMVGVDFIVNAVKNIDGDVVAVVAGDLEAAHLRGVELCKESWQVTLPQQFDISIVSAGGYPKDIDLHQAQKAISAAELVTRKGGPIVVVAECRDGTGKFAKALHKAASPQDVIDRFLTEGFQADEHTSKAFLFARALVDHPIFIVSDQLAVDDVDGMFMTCVRPSSVDALVASLCSPSAISRSVLVAPNAVDCLFSVTATDSGREMATF